MKPALHLIWSPLLYSVTGFLMAYGIANVSNTDPVFQRFILLAMPTSGLFIGWFIAYLATPIKMRPDTTFISDTLASNQTGIKTAVTSTE